MSVAAPPRPATRTTTVLLVVAIVVLALNLRGPIVAVSPVLDQIRADLGIGAGVAGLLTSLPVLCFALATPLAAALLARAGLERAVLLALGALLAGTLLRSADGLSAVIAGTLVIGIAITVGNVAVPVVIGRDVSPVRAGLVLGTYTAALNVGSMITLSLTVPLAGVVGWRAALAVWGGLAVVAAGAWWLGTRGNAARAAAAPVATGVADGPVWWRRPIVWGLTIAFAGQAFSYYGVTAWLPLLLRDELGMDAAEAGVSSSVFQIAAVVGAFGVPVLLRLFDGPRPALLVVVAAWCALPLGLLAAPQGWALWCALGGVAQGGGYLVAATGPAVVGTVHDATGGWTAPLLVVLAAIGVLAVAGSLSAHPTRDGVVAAPGPD